MISDEEFANLQKIQLDRQISLTPIHEAGHTMAALSLGLPFHFVDIRVQADGQCGLTKMQSDPQIYEGGLPLYREHAHDQFDRRNVQLLAGAAAQAEYCFLEGIRRLDGGAMPLAENWSRMLEFSENADFCERIREEYLAPGLACFLNDFGASVDWANILQHFRTLPYDYFEEYATHELRTEYLRDLWVRALRLLRDSWSNVQLIAAELRARTTLTADEVRSLLE